MHESARTWMGGGRSQDNLREVVLSLSAPSEFQEWNLGHQTYQPKTVSGKSSHLNKC